MISHVGWLTRFKAYRRKGKSSECTAHVTALFKSSFHTLSRAPGQSSSLVVVRLVRISQVEDDSRMWPCATTLRELAQEVNAAVEAQAAIG